MEVGALKVKGESLKNGAGRAMEILTLVMDLGERDIGQSVIRCGVLYGYYTCVQPYSMGDEGVFV